MNTRTGWAIFLDKNEMAATLLAKGHGLIDVKIPSHNADAKLKNIAVIELLSIDRRPRSSRNQ
jgi:predicted transcriptional regulator